MFRPGARINVWWWAYMTGKREDQAVQENGGQAEADGDDGRLERELHVVQMPTKNRF
jgi:cbb3-type cytochrome oxidase subunit 3